MREKCEQQKHKNIEQLMAEAAELAAGKFPESITAFSESGEPEGMERYEALGHYLAVRAALIMSMATGRSPALCLGITAGEILGVELEAAAQDFAAEQAVRRSAPFN